MSRQPNAWLAATSGSVAFFRSGKLVSNRSAVASSGISSYELGRLTFSASVSVEIGGSPLADHDDQNRVGVWPKRGSTSIYGFLPVREVDAPRRRARPLRPERRSWESFDTWSAFPGESARAVPGAAEAGPWSWGPGWSFGQRAIDVML